LLFLEKTLLLIRGDRYKEGAHVPILGFSLRIAVSDVAPLCDPAAKAAN
jgi:hypothetical protein